MDWKKIANRLKNKTVWVSLLIGLVPLVAGAFGFVLPVDYSEIIYTVLGILVAVGVLADPTGDKPDKPNDHNNKPL